jgi:hypothetical protein
MHGISQKLNLRLPERIPMKLENPFWGEREKTEKDQIKTTVVE